MEYLLAVFGTKEDTVIEVLDHLGKMGNIDAELWSKKKVIWCDALVDNLADLYSRRKESAPTKPVL